jgi:hypothetical protein
MPAANHPAKNGAQGPAQMFLFVPNAAKARRLPSYSNIGDQAGSDAACGVGMGWLL